MKRISIAYLFVVLCIQVMVGQNRPQEPKDFPYFVSEVTFFNDEDSISLVGTLTVPKDSTFDAIIVLVSGSGPQDRDATLGPFNHRPNLVLSDYLCRNGYAVLRYDERGVGASEGTYYTATTLDLAKDVSSAIDYLALYVGNKPIGILGHSEGGIIAPMVSQMNAKVDFIITLAGPVLKIRNVMIQQLEDVLLSEESSSAYVQRYSHSVKLAYDFVLAHPNMPNDSLGMAIRTLLMKDYATYPDTLLTELKIPEGTAMQIAFTLIQPWFKYFIQIDPAQYFDDLTIPVLAIYGENDIQVNGKTNANALEKILDAKELYHEIYLLPQINHLMQKSKTGKIDEYKEIAETINQEILEIIKTFLKTITM